MSFSACRSGRKPRKLRTGSSAAHGGLQIKGLGLETKQLDHSPQAVVEYAIRVLFQKVKTRIEEFLAWQVIVTCIIVELSPKALLEVVQMKTGISFGGREFCPGPDHIVFSTANVLGPLNCPPMQELG
jgi:hypothetical protein